MNIIHILTRCSRPNNLLKVVNSIPKAEDIVWHIIFDATKLKEIDVELLTKLQEFSPRIYFAHSHGGDHLFPETNKIIKNYIQSGWIYLLDDDNILHKNFYEKVKQHIRDSVDVIVFNQHVAGKDFTGLDVRYAKPENMKVSHVDSAQFVLNRKVFDRIEFEACYIADGIIIEKAYKSNPNGFVFIDEILSYYNYLQKAPSAKVPKILYIGEGTPDLKSLHFADYESQDLDVEYINDDSNIFEDLARVKPIAIVSAYNDPRDLKILWNAPYEFRKMWINVQPGDPLTGEKAYNCAMTTMLNSDNSKLISYFTSVYNTGEKLLTTYTSLKEQTYINWEWVIVNDSSDGGNTLKIANSIAAKDPRVRVFDITPKSGGIIGEAKWRAATLCRGYILAELDHDDYLIPTCTEDLYNASQAHKNAGFFYTDSAEIDQNWNSLTYPPGFGLGYGYYRNEEVLGKTFKVAVSSNINPKTIRHIVGVPNHVRAWRREVYFEIGGHCRDLAIADDYELIVRTFLKTEMVRIPRLGYLQFIYNNGDVMNSHELARKDIQRRVRTIMWHYNDKIKSRFEELGLKDWAYEENPNDPLSAHSKFGAQEGYANEIYKI